MQSRGCRVERRLCAPRWKYRAGRGIAYGAGLRAGEVVKLRISDIAQSAC